MPNKLKTGNAPERVIQDPTDKVLLLGSVYTVESERLFYADIGISIYCC